MKTRIIAFLLCLVILFNISAHGVYAVSASTNESSNVVTIGSDVFLSGENSDCRYIFSLNTSTSNGIFSVLYFDNAEYVFEYYFSFNVDELNVNSSVFWANLAADCFANSNLWHSFYIPTTTIVATNSNEGIALLSSDTYADQLVEWAEEEFDTAPYTGKILATGYKGSLILQVKENYTYKAEPYSTITVQQAISAAGLMLSLYGAITNPGLLSFLGLMASASGLIPAGSVVKTYYVYAQWDRYVTRKDSSVWLNTTQKYISYKAYVNCNTGSWEVDANTKTTQYSPSQSYFEDLYTQIDDGYDYYINS